MRYSNTFLAFACLAVGFFISQVSAQAFEIKPNFFLANKPIQATLYLSDKTEKIDNIRIVPGGPYIKESLDYETPITITKTAHGFRYTAYTARGIEIVNLADKNTAPRHIGGETTTYNTIDVNDNFLLAVTETGSVHLFSLNNDEAAMPNGIYETHANIIQAQLSPPYAYLLADTGTLFILDITSPEWPLLAGEYYGSSDSRRFAFHQGLIWLAAGEQGLVVLDTANPLNIKKIASYKTNQPALDIALQNNTALLTTGIGGLTLFNIEDPKKIVWLGSHSKLGYAQRVAANTHYQAAVTDSQNNIYHLDYSLPSQPTIINALHHPDPITHLSLHEQTLTLVSQYNITHWDIRSEQALISNENLNMGEGVNFGGQRKGFIENDILYVADWFSGIHIYDIRQGQNPRLLSSFHTPGSPKGVVVKENIAYVADDDHGLQLIDVSSPTAPQAVSHILTKGLAYTPVIEDHLLYLASHHGGFQIIDIEDIFQPKLLGEYDTPNKAWSIAVKNKIAYVADAESGLLIFDTHNPSKPQLIGHFNPDGNAEDVIIEGNLAYVAFFDQGIHILDISDPRQPRSLSHLPTPGNARGLDIRGFVLYVADWLGGVHAINIADPKQPKLMGSYDSQGAVWGVLSQKEFTYIFDWWGGLSVLDTRFPSDIRKAGDYNQRTPIAQLSARGDFLYAAQGHRGLQVYDIKNPLNPTWVTGEEVQGNLSDISLHGSYVYAAAEESGLAVFNIDNPYFPQLISQHSTIEPLVGIKALDAMVYGQDRLGHIIGFDISQPAQPRRIFQTSLTYAKNYQVNKHHLVTSRDKELIYYTLNQGAPSGPGISLQFDNRIKLIQLANNIAHIIDQKNNLHIIDLSANKPQLLTTSTLNHDVVNSLLDGSLLHIIDKQEGVFTYRINNDHSLTPITQYPLLSHIDSLYAYRDQLYGIGENFILAINKLPIVRLTDTNEPSIKKLSITKGLANGAYDLLITKGGQTQRFPNALTTAYFGTPTIRENPSTDAQTDTVPSTPDFPKNAVDDN